MEDIDFEHMNAEVKKIYQLWALGFEKQVELDLVDAIYEGLRDAGVNPEDFVIYSKTNLRFTTKSTDEEIALQKFIDNNASILLAEVKRVCKKRKGGLRNQKKKHLNVLLNSLKKMKGCEFDVLIFCFDKTNPERKFEFTFFAERNIRVETPFCLLNEVTLIGPRKTLEAKIERVTLQLLVLTELSPFSSDDFGQYNDVIIHLLTSRAINLYPFIIINGVLVTQHDIFNEFFLNQRKEVLQLFKFYKMVKGVCDSSIGRIEHMYHKRRIDNEISIDLLHINNRCDPMQLYAKIVENQNLNNQSFKEINNRLDALDGKIKTLEVETKNSFAKLFMGMWIIGGFQFVMFIIWLCYH